MDSKQTNEIICTLGGLLKFGVHWTYYVMERLQIYIKDQRGTAPLLLVNLNGVNQVGKAQRTNNAIL